MFLYKAEVQVDQQPPHKNRYTEDNRRESGKEPQTHQHRENFPEQNTNGSGCKSNYRQMGSPKVEKFL